MRLDDSDRVPLIVETVVRVCGADIDDVYRHDKHRRPSLVRHIAWACAWMLTDLPWTRLAERFDRNARTFREGTDTLIGTNAKPCDEFVVALRACERTILNQEAKMSEALQR